MLFAAPRFLPESLQLLDQQYADTVVRECRAQTVEAVDEDLQTILLQLVQVIKYELFHDRLPARFSSAGLCFRR